MIVASEVEVDEEAAGTDEDCSQSVHYERCAFLLPSHTGFEVCVSIA